MCHDMLLGDENVDLVKDLKRDSHDTISCVFVTLAASRSVVTFELRRLILKNWCDLNWFKTVSFVRRQMNWMKKNWVDCLRVFFQLKIYYLSRLNLQNIFFFSILHKHRDSGAYIKGTIGPCYPPIPLSPPWYWQS